MNKKLRVWHIYNHRASYTKAKDFNPLQGNGGLLAANRWNNIGHRVLYTAQSASLAALEILVHVNPNLFGERTVLELEITLKKFSVEEVSLESFYQMRRDASPNDDRNLSQEFGTRWLMEKRSLLLCVPSAVVPWEQNYVLNPSHKDALKIRIVRQDVFRLDPRIGQGG